MKFFENKRRNIILGLILAVILLVVAFSVFRNGQQESFEVTKADFTQTVLISGKVTPAQEIDLGFEVTGMVKNLFVDVGDNVLVGQVLAVLDQDEIYSEISESRTLLQSEIARLDDLIGSAGSQSQLESEKKELISVLEKSRIEADGIIRNRVDSFFDNPDKAFPEFSTSLNNYSIRQELNEKRVEIESLLNEWRTRNSGLNISNVTYTDAEYSINALVQIEDILVTISTGTPDFKANSDVTQSQIDAYVSNINQSRTAVSNLIIEVNQAIESVRSIEAEVPVQQAKVENAEATLSKFNSRVNKYSITAPFSGVITAKDIEIGEVVDLGKDAISMISADNLEVEVFIPEVRIAGVQVGNMANITLDAFGPNKIFKAQITHVDPSGTEKDGINTYRALLNFIESYPEIKSGMTAEVSIEKQRINDVLVIPYHFVVEKDGKTLVQLQRSKGPNREVDLGLRDGKGGVIVESGLSEGEIIVLPK